MEPQTVEKLRKDLKSQDRYCRSTATWRLAKAGLVTFEELLPLLQDEGGIVRLRAAEALAALGESQAVRPLLPLLEDERDIVRNFVESKLRKLVGDLGPAESAPVLQDVRRAFIRSRIVLEVPTALVREMGSLIARHYPEARCSSEWNGLHLECVLEAHPRTYSGLFSHGPGNDPAPLTLVGRKENGVFCYLSLERGDPLGACAVRQPWIEDCGPFREMFLSPYSEAHDCSLFATLRYAPGAAESFLQEYQALVRSFARYMD